MGGCLIWSNGDVMLHKYNMMSHLIECWKLNLAAGKITVTILWTLYVNKCAVLFYGIKMAFKPWGNKLRYTRDFEERLRGWVVNLLSVQNPHAYIVGLKWICRKSCSQIDKGVQTPLNQKKEKFREQYLRCKVEQVFHQQTQRWLTGLLEESSFILVYILRKGFSSLLYQGQDWLRFRSNLVTSGKWSKQMT